MENQPKVREYDRVKYSDKDMWLAMTKVGFALFFVFGIYFRFIVVEDNQKSDRETQKVIVENLLTELESIHKIHTKDNIEIYARIKEKDDAQRLRLDTKTKRNKEAIDKNTIDINKLKQPNTDNKK